MVVCCCESSWGKWVKMEPGLQILCIGFEVCEIPNLIILETYFQNSEQKGFKTTYTRTSLAKVKWVLVMPYRKNLVHIPKEDCK